MTKENTKMIRRLKLGNKVKPIENKVKGILRLKVKYQKYRTARVTWWIER